MKTTLACQSGRCGGQMCSSRSGTLSNYFNIFFFFSGGKVPNEWHQLADACLSFPWEFHGEIQTIPKDDGPNIQINLTKIDHWWAEMNEISLKVIWTKKGTNKRIEKWRHSIGCWWLVPAVSIIFFHHFPQDFHSSPLGGHCRQGAPIHLTRWRHF